MKDYVIEKNLWVLGALFALWYMFGIQDIYISLAIIGISALYAILLLVLTKEDRLEEETYRCVEAIMFTIFLCLLALCYAYKSDIPETLFYILSSLFNGFVISIFIGPLFGRRWG